MLEPEFIHYAENSRRHYENCKPRGDLESKIYAGIVIIIIIQLQPDSNPRLVKSQLPSNFY